MANLHNKTHISDDELTEQQYVDKYMPICTVTEEYLRARYLLMKTKTSEAHHQAFMQVTEAYRKTQAYLIHYGHGKRS